MNKEAVEHIQFSNVAQQTAKLTDGLAIALPHGYDVQSLEQFKDHKTRFQGQYVTPSLADWAAYVTNNCDEKSHVFVDSEKLYARAIVDLGTKDKPLHAQHKALLNMKLTPFYRNLLMVNEKDLRQAEMILFLEDWNDYLTILDADEEAMNLAEAVNAIRKIEVHTTSQSEFDEQESSRKLSRSEQIEANSKGRKIHSLRTTFVPSEGLSPVQAEVRVVILAEQTPKIRLRIMKLEVLQESIAQDFKAVLKGSIPENIEVFVGNFE